MHDVVTKKYISCRTFMIRLFFLWAFLQSPVSLLRRVEWKRTHTSCEVQIWDWMFSRTLTSLICYTTLERIERLVVRASKRSMISLVLLCYIYFESAICFNLRPVQQATFQTKNDRRRLSSFSWIALSFPSSLSSIYKDRRRIRRAIEIRKSVCSGHIQEEIVAHDILFKTSFF